MCILRIGVYVNLDLDICICLLAHSFFKLIESQWLDSKQWAPLRAGRNAKIEWPRDQSTDEETIFTLNVHVYLDVIS